ncbi:MAG: pitrilysin family protein [Pseudomonadota bacterium]|nr:pitrilysin family protein [Pseudomonadota bacterium]
MPIQIHRLDNGLTVVIHQQKGSRMISADFGAWGGPRVEGTDQAGLSNLLGHVSLYGSERHNRDEIIRLTEGRGGAIYYKAARSKMCWSAGGLSEHADTLLDVLGGVVSAPLFAPDDIQKQKNIVFEQIKEEQGNNFKQGLDAFFATAFAGQGLGNSVLGQADMLAGYTQKDIIAFKEAWLRGGDCVLSLVGDVEPARMLDMAETHFGGLTKGKSVVRPALVYGGGANVTMQNDEQLHLFIGFEGAAIGDADYYAHELLGETLGGGMGSPLFGATRDKGLVYAVRSQPLEYDGSGMFMIYGGVSNGKARDYTDTVFTTIDEFSAKPIQPQTLEAAVTTMVNDLAMSLQGQSDASMIYCSQMLEHGRLILPDDYRKALNAITPDDVRNAGLRLLESKIALSAVGPAKGLVDDAAMNARAKQILDKYGPVPAKPEPAPVVSAPTSYTAKDSVPETKVKMTVLPNGQKFVTVSRSGADTVSLGYWMKVGSGDEPMNIKGGAHMLEHNNFHGSPGYASKEIEEIISNEWGGTLNAQTSFGHTCYFCIVPAECLDKALPMFSGMTFDADLPAERFERVDKDGNPEGEKHVVLTELGMYKDKSSTWNFFQLIESAYDGQSYAGNILGPKATLEKMTVADLKKFRDDYYAPEKATLVVVGDVDHDALLPLVEKMDGARVNPPTTETLPPVFKPVMRTLIRDKEDTVHFGLAFEAVPDSHPDAHVYKAASILLGRCGDKGSCLYQRLLAGDTQQVAYVEADTTFLGKAGLLMVLAGSDHANVEPALEAVCEEIRAFPNGLTDEKLTQVKSCMIADILETYQVMGDCCAEVGLSTLTFGKPLTLDDEIARIEAMTLADLKRVATKIANSEPAVSAIGPCEDMPSHDKIKAMLRIPPDGPGVRHDTFKPKGP